MAGPPTSPLATRLVGRAVPTARLEAVAGACAISLMPSAEVAARAGGRIVHLGDGVEALEDEALWNVPAFAWIDIGGSSDDELAGLIRRAMSVDLYCSLSTRAAAEIHVAGLLTKVAAARRPMPLERREDIELALHEAISNALVHGNLGMSSMRTLCISELDTYSTDMTTRLSDPSLAGRRLEVSACYEEGALVVVVADQGDGYVGADSDNEGASGRGLALIAGIAQQCIVEDGGRRITMRFSL